jgi:hypothetical protein
MLENEARKSKYSHNPEKRFDGRASKTIPRLTETGTAKIHGIS